MRARGYLCLVLITLGACGGSDSAAPCPRAGLADLLDGTCRAPVAARLAAVAAEPDYWPTSAWQSTAPENRGFAAGSLAGLGARIDADLPFLTSLVVVRNGYIVHESYHTPDGEPTVDASSKHHVWSVSKSVNSLTFAAARQQGVLADDDLDTTVADAFPTLLADMAADDPRRAISVRHVLRMQSGIDWNEPEDLLDFAEDPLFASHPACANDYQRVLCVYLHRDLAKAPGSTWNYSTYDSYVLSALFSSFTEVRLADFADQHLFTPLGMDYQSGDWPSLPEPGYTYGGGLLFITTRDMARLGQLVLYEGRWDGQQILHPDWLARSLTPIGEGEVMQFDGVTGDPLADSLATSVDYAEQWWIDGWSGIEGYSVVGARGLGGQYIFVFPELGLVIAATSHVDNPADPGIGGRTALVAAILEDVVLAGLQP